MKNKFKLGVIIAIILFIVIFTCKLIYEFTGGSSNNIYSQSYIQNNKVQLNNDIIYEDQSTNSIINVKKNYATNEQKKEAPFGKNEVSFEQKYEKSANIESRTSSYEDDEKKLRNIIKENDGIVQYEQKSGLKGNRFLYLSIGVSPDKFDKIVELFKLIGKLKDLKINLTDKTSEFNNLNSERAALEKHIQNLMNLKKQGGNIEEKLNLETQIYELEKQIQDFGIKLGDFSKENEFNTINLTLSEAKVSKINYTKIIFMSIKWAVITYLTIIFIIGISSVFLLIIIKLIEKLNWIPNFIKDYWKK